MSQRILWELPVPSTALVDGPIFEKRPRRVVALRMRYEVDDGEKAVALVFEGLETFKVTYDRARADSMLEAYDRLIDAGDTSWVQEISHNLLAHGEHVTDLRHLMINFDDGPCYEFICRSYRLE